MNNIVLIDDKRGLLDELEEALAQILPEDVAEVRTWVPVDGADLGKEFQEIVDNETVVVITDYDLTQQGAIGFFGATVVSWCQARSIPVGDFSRGNVSKLPAVPNLFELRVPDGIDDAARYSATVYLGFKEIRNKLTGDTAELMAVRSPAEALAAVLERPYLEAQFALYMSRLGSANSSLLDRFGLELPQDQATRDSKKERLLAYIVGHVLVNGVLRYPGPILSQRALCAYVSTTESESEDIAVLFSQAQYGGPFSSNDAFFWRLEVDAVLHRAAEQVNDLKTATSGEFNRGVVEATIGRSLARHECARCGGINGGYLCPFTNRPVCDRADCSVAANSWLPAGADLCRIERDFYDEWAPLLGL